MMGVWIVLVTPSRASLVRGSVKRVSPSRTSPELARYTPAMTFSSVVLPLPFGPMRPAIWPGSALRLTSERACTARTTSRHCGR